MRFLERFCAVIFSSFALLASSQNTVGVLNFHEESTLDGFTLLYPLSQADVFLVNNCGEVVHEWQDSSYFRPGNSIYLLPNGNLLKTKKPMGFIEGSFSSGGSGGIVELRSWDNELLWSTTVMNSEYRAHHDVELLPNGNVLIIVWQRRSREEYLSAGGDSLLYNRDEIWPDIVQEYDPSLDSIVWTWDSWNHLVQDHNPAMDNFGNVFTSKGKIDLNYDLDGTGGRADWIHSNSIDYNEELDQILLSAAFFDEMWIIDHSTTTEEAKGNFGGNSDKGGQLLFRWGNPRAYKAGDEKDKKLFFQHDVQWIDELQLQNSEYYGQIGLFNNRIAGDKSAINLINPTFEIGNNAYVSNGQGVFQPQEYNMILESSTSLNFQSSSMSGMQLLPNGNFLVCAAQRGTVFEFTANRQLVWRYVLPFRNGFRIEQGTDLSLGDNVLFRAKKYGSNYDAFVGRDLPPKYKLELNPNSEFCDVVSVADNSTYDISLFPNPVFDEVIIESTSRSYVKIRDGLGRLVYADDIGIGRQQIYIGNLAPSIYTVSCYSSDGILISSSRLVKL